MDKFVQMNENKKGVRRNCNKIYDIKNVVPTSSHEIRNFSLE